MNTKKIRVVYIITKLELGGAQKVCLSLFNGLSQKGCNSFLISGKHGPLVYQVENNQAALLIDSMQRELSIKAIFKEIHTFFTLITTLRTMRQEHPHLIVHTHSTKAGILGRWAAFFARVPYRIHTVHGFAFHEHQSLRAWYSIFLVEWLTSFITSHFICVSAHDVKIGLRLLPGFSKKNSIIRAGVEAQQFINQSHTCCNPSQKQPFIFGTISCFKPQKNLFDLLNAFNTVYQKDQRARLEIIGDGIQRPQIEKWIKEHNLNNVITLHGWQQNVLSVMKHWHCFALSSLWEGLPCAAVEARLLHLPVLSYQVGGIAEVIDHERNGLLADPGDWQQLATNMLRTMHDEKLYKNMSSYQDNLADFDSRQMVDDHLNLYKQIMHQ